MEYIGSMAAYDRKMPESNIRSRKQFSAFQLRKIDWGPPESFSEPKKDAAAGKQAGKTYNTVGMGNIKFIWLCPR
jgi:hypothetical protein